jgi:general secretion pathway protein M
MNFWHMNSTKQLSGAAPSPPHAAALIYICLLLAFVAATALPLKGLFDRQAAVGELGDTLLRLEHGGLATARPAGADGPVVGSSLLEGATVTVAGAALLQRVVGAVTRHGGSILSSQLDLQGPQSKQGFLSVGASFDLEQGALQEIVYDLEAGMPFLFVDQLVVQAPTVSTGLSGGKLRVLISVSGQWQGAQ